MAKATSVLFLIAAPSAAWGSERTRTILSALAPVLIGLAATLAALRLRQPLWRRLAIAFGCWWLGDLVALVTEVVLRQEPFPAVAAGARLAFYPCATWALLKFPAGARRRGEGLKHRADALIVVLSAAMGVWYLAVGPAVHDRTGGGLAQTLAVAFAVADLLLLFGMVVNLRRRTTSGNAALRILFAGLSALLVADVVIISASLADGYAGRIPDAVRAATWCVFLVAARTAGRAAAEEAARAIRTRRSDGHPSLAGLGRSHPRRDDARPDRLPYLAVAMAYGLLLIVGLPAAVYPLDGLIIGAAAVTAAILVSQVSMIRENTRLLSRLRNLADVDSLTGIPNRRAFFEEAELLFEDDRRSPRAATAAGAGPGAAGGAGPPRHSVLMIDVDYFKEINDTYGHRTGDRVLSVVAAGVKSQLRSADLVGRYGGDELILALADCDGSAAMAVAERIHTVVASTPVVTDEGVVNVTLSIGVAGSEDGEGLLPVLARADLALYEAKRAGRACVREFAAAHPQSSAPLTDR